MGYHKMHHGSMNHSSTNHGAMDHSSMGHGAMDHSSMGHGAMDHSSMDHSSIDHSSMDHSSMDHSSMDHSSMGHGASHGDHSGHSMMMYFHSSTQSHILFSFWQTNSILTMFLSCVAIIIMGILYEGLKALREHLLMRKSCCSGRKCQHSSVAIVSSKDLEDGGGDNCCSKQQPLFEENKPSIRESRFNAAHLIQTLLHGVQMVLSYFLMLIFMTYNIWPCASVVIGAMIGYLIFCWKKQRCGGCAPNKSYTIGDHCH